MSEKQYLGVFDAIEDACDAAVTAQKELIQKYTTEERQKFIENIKKYALDKLEEICMMEWKETGYGRYEDKVDKNGGSFQMTPDTKDIPVPVSYTHLDVYKRQV